MDLRLFVHHLYCYPYFNSYFILYFPGIPISIIYGHNNHKVTHTQTHTRAHAPLPTFRLAKVADSAIK